MFVKIYRYIIKTEDQDRWKALVEKTDDLYQSYGSHRFEKMIRNQGKTCAVLEMAFYHTRTEFERITESVNADPQLPDLFAQFKEIIEGRVSVEEYEKI